MALLHQLRRDVRAHVWDYAVAGAMVVVAMVALVTRIDVQDADAHLFRPDTAWSWAVTIAVCAALVGRRRWPLRTLAVVLVLILPLELAHHRDSPAFFALVCALFSVAAYLPLRLAWRGVAMVAAMYGVLLATGTMIVSTAPLVGNILLTMGFGLGWVLRRNRARQAHELTVAIERATEAAEAADLQAADERLRMAQELHDVVAHSLSVIAVQAGIGVHLMDRRPGDAARALDAIVTTSHAAADELGRLVEVLRDGSSAATGAAPDLRGVAALVEQIGVAGVPIVLSTDGDLGSVPAGVSLAAYRIVQEALTNVVRHAGRASATVSIEVGADRVHLCIEDDGHGMTTAAGSDDHEGGHGLIGMGERARMYGGEVRSGPRPGGGFRVQATLQCGAGPAIVPTSKDESADVGASTAGPGITSRSTTSTRRRLPGWAWDALLVSVMTVVATIEILGPHPATGGPSYAPSDIWAWLLRSGCCLSLAGRRRHPVASLAVMWTLGIALAIGNYEVGVITFVLWIGLYSVGCNATTKRLIASVIGTYLGVAVVAWSRPPDLTASGAVWVGVLFTGAAVAGFVVRRDHQAVANDLAIRRDAADARSRRARLVVANERLRIADELSTIITRSIRTITFEAGVGAEAIDRDPRSASAALQSISETSREALNDLRHLLKHMRTADGAALYTPAASTPVATGDGA